MNNSPPLETPRLVLRRFDPDDIQALYAIYSDTEVNTYLPWFPLKSLTQAWEFYNARYAEAYKQPGEYKYAVCLKSDNIPIGYVHAGGADNYDFGYGLRKEFWHRGLITEACEAVVAQLRKTDIPYITATHDINNQRSGNVMKNIGMTYRYSYEEQWQPKDIKVVFRMYQLDFNGSVKTYKGYWNKYSKHFIEEGV